MIILLKWHEIHDSGLYSVQILSSVILRQSVLPLLRSVQDDPHRAAPCWKDKSQILEFNSILIFPRKRGVWGLGLGLIPHLCQWGPWSDPKNPSKSHCHREGIAEYTNFIPQHKWMTFKQLEAGWIYILLQKKREVHTWGERGWTTVVWTQVSTLLPTVATSVWLGRAPASHHTPAYNSNRIVDQGNSFKVEAQMEIVRYHTQCKFIVHSIFS